MYFSFFLNETVQLHRKSVKVPRKTVDTDSKGMGNMLVVRVASCELRVASHIASCKLICELQITLHSEVIRNSKLVQLFIRAIKIHK